MNTLDRETIADHFKSFQAQIYERIEGFEDNKSFIKDGWEKQNLGSGLSIVVDDGQVFNKAGINFSQIAGDSLPDSSLGILNESEKLPYFATGVSVVFHPNNPNIPTAHLNVRYFCTTKDGEIHNHWFGGGFDLTPYILFEEDCYDWHKSAKNACDQTDPDFYKTFKKNCDEYFYIPHRNEHRGVGGIFYEKLEIPLDQGIKFSKDVCAAFIETYTKILEKRKDLNFTQRDVDFQKFRRGRYVEFNLIHDRGTLFGLQTSGRIESILMSLPKDVNWRYKFDDNLEEKEKNLYEHITKPKDWLNE